MITTKVILLENVPIPDPKSGWKFLDIPIHIIRIDRQTLAVLELPYSQIPYVNMRGKLVTHGPILGYEFPHGSATRNPKDIDNPEISERLAVRRACCDCSLDLEELGFVGRIIWRHYREWLKREKAAILADLLKDKL